MEYISVGDLKSYFSNLLNEIQNNGKKYIIEYGKKHKKVAMIIPCDRKLEERADRGFVLLDGQYRVPGNFNKESKEMSDMFYGSN